MVDLEPKKGKYRRKDGLELDKSDGRSPPCGMMNHIPVKDLLLLLCANTLVAKQQIKKWGLR